MKTALLSILLFVLWSFVSARDAEYFMQLSDLQFSASMLEKEYEITGNEDTYQELVMTYWEMEGMEIDRGNCPFIENSRAKQLCNVRWRNVFIPGQIAYEQQHPKKTTK